jgi:hypothetical protein
MLLVDNPAALSVLGGSTNRFKDATTVSGGTLEMASPGALANDTSLTVGDSAAFAPEGLPTDVPSLAAFPAEAAAAIPDPPALALLAAGALLAAAGIVAGRFGVGR